MSSTATSEHAITTTWPEGFAMVNPPAHGFAVREVAAPADAVFAWIRRPDLHADFYKGLRAVRRLSGPWKPVDVGTKLSFLVDFSFVPMVKVNQCDPATRSFAWIADVPGLKVCHAFTVEPIDEHRSLVRSEEQWEGAIAKLIAPVARGPIQKVQTDWVNAIVTAATSHPSGPPAA